MKLIRLLSLTALAPLFASGALAQIAVIGGYAGCKDRDNMARVLDLADQGDLAAAQELVARGIKSQDCRVLAGDDIVFEATPPFTRIIKVHVRGNPDVYWIIQ
ncbi:hypothetical protein [Methylosinus sp. Sm6]|uniref:hypothetical protein n=1 Tax=Methylosinus sp. Sm6 TaxID=2866948 RepID=UPI001C99F72F|nr:hypothetical protein [Methylosinus sp. Sm6]MBY6242104.1 hypothetical protein [Methylosinus sp. Sm6]